MKKLCILLVAAIFSASAGWASGSVENYGIEDNECCGKNVDEKVVKSIDSYIQKVQKEWQLTGVAAAFSKGGEVFYS